MPRKHKPRKTTPRRAAKGGRGRRPRPAFSSSQIRTKNVTRYTSTRRVRNWREKEKFEVHFGRGGKVIKIIIGVCRGGKAILSIPSWIIFHREIGWDR